MRIPSLFLIILLVLSCKENKKENIEPAISQPTTISKPLNYPEALTKIFNAHGGLTKWKTHRTLSYMINGEIQTIDLYTRKDKIKNPAFEMGFDGNNVWLLDPKKTYEGDPVFYHNLMFYFYAMPFVLADNGIVYSKTTDLVFEEKAYPGIRISYNNGIGTTPKDEYFLHYNPETFKMEWLGYTVTYKSDEKSDNVKWIRYSDWMTIEDLILPSAITWYAYEGREIKEPKKVVNFESVMLSKQAETDDFYAVPESALVVTKKQ